MLLLATLAAHCFAHSSTVHLSRATKRASCSRRKSCANCCANAALTSPPNTPPTNNLKTLACSTYCLFALLYSMMFCRYGRVLPPLCSCSAASRKDAQRMHVVVTRCCPSTHHSNGSSSLLASLLLSSLCLNNVFPVPCPTLPPPPQPYP